MVFREVMREFGFGACAISTKTVCHPPSEPPLINIHNNNSNNQLE